MFPLVQPKNTCSVAVSHLLPKPTRVLGYYCLFTECAIAYRLQKVPYKERILSRQRKRPFQVAWLPMNIKKHGFYFYDIWKTSLICRALGQIFSETLVFKLFSPQYLFLTTSVRILGTRLLSWSKYLCICFHNNWGIL